MNKKVKKVIGISFLIFTLVIIGGIVALFLALNSIVANEIRAFGTQATGTKVELQSVNILPFSGSVELKGVCIANPKDCQNQNAFALGRFYVDMNLKSLFTDRIVINNVIIEDAAVDFEPSVSQGSNLHEIKHNIMQYCKGQEAEKKESAKQEPSAQKPGKTVMIKYFVIKGGTISVSSSLLKTSVNVPMPKIEMQDIGGDNNKSGGDVFQEIFNQTLQGIGTAVSQVRGIKLDSVTEDVSNATEGVGKGVKEGFKSLKSSLGL